MIISSFRKGVLYLLDFAGISTSAYMIVTEVYKLLGDWDLLGQGSGLSGEMYAALDQALFKGFALMMASIIFLTFLLGWRQKQVCFLTIFLAALVQFFLPFPKLSVVLFCSGLIGVTLTYFLESLKSGVNK